jgi:hypothetical protein
MTIDMEPIAPGAPPIVLEEVIDKANGNDMQLPKVLYYKVGGIEEDEVRRYTVEEAAALMLEHGHYGPWGCAECGHSKAEHPRDYGGQTRCIHELDADWDGERYIQTSGCRCPHYEEEA